MRVLIVTSYNNGQIAPFVAEQVDALRRSGMECDYYLVRGKGLSGYLCNRTTLQQKIQSFQPDLVHAHYGLCGLLANLQRQVPVVTTFHGSDINNWHLRPFSLLAHWLSAHSIFVSDALRRKLGANVPHCSVLPCGVDTTLFAPMDREEARRQLYLPTGQPLVLFAGTYADPVKNIELARAALEYTPDARLIEPRGYSRKQMALLFNAVDLLLVTSHHEGSPQVVKEALACNCPVVSVDVGDVRDMTNGVQGCCIVERDARKLGQAIQNRLNQPLHAHGRQHLLDRQLDITHVTETITGIYNTVLHARTN